MKTYSAIKLAIGLRMFPDLTMRELSKKLDISLRTLYSNYGEAAMYAKSWIPNLVTPEELILLTGRDLAVLHYLYVATPNLKKSEHLWNLRMSDKTFEKALFKLRTMKLIDRGTKGKPITPRIVELNTQLPLFLN